MARIYIDFDSTLYNTDKMRGFDQALEKGICECTNLSLKEAEKEIQIVSESMSPRKIYDICKILEQKFDLEENYLKNKIEEFVEKGEHLVFEDSVPFLKRLVQKGHEINILTYTNKEFEYQMSKLKGSKILDLVHNVIMCSEHKGELGLDYENSIFIDDNPRELESLFKAGVSEDRLIRVRRIGGNYSKIETNGFKPREVLSFAEIDNL